MSSDLGKANTLDAIEEGIEPPRPSDTVVVDDPLLGRLIDERYRIAARLGAGGMGIVYEARHEILGSRLAFKVLKGDAAGDEEAIERLKREAQAASAIGNEHIVDVRDFGRLDDGSVYIVMELIEGIDLYTLVKREPIAWRRAQDIAHQIAEALYAAHQQGIVHRDLKLENVLLTLRRGRNDFVKVVDFGIAKMHGVTKLTAAGRVMGTPEYMSPEQCAGKTVDHRTDIYSLGVMLYEMVTQKLPFWDPELARLIRMQMKDAPVPPSKLRPDLEIPLAFEAVILRCLAKDPDARFQTMRAVMQALRVSSTSDVPSAEPDEPATRSDPTATTEPPPSTDVVVARSTPTQGSATANKPWLWPALALLVLSVAGTGGWLIGRDLTDPEPPPPAPEVSEVAIETPVEPPPATREVPAPEVPAVVEPPQPTASATITVFTEPASASVYAGDGALLGETPFEVLRPEPGERLEVELRADGFQDQAVAIRHVSAEELHVRLEPRPTVRRDRPTTEDHESTTPPERQQTPDGPRRHQEFLDPWGN